ncbi:MAG: hypothetical protein WKF97_12430 [Chitinophagaceae bacterium]
MQAKFAGIEIEITEAKSNSPELTTSLMEEPAVKSYFEQSRYRILSTKRTGSTQMETKAARKSIPVESSQVVAYNYTKNCCVFLTSGQTEPVEIVESNLQPVPTDEEFEDAFDIIFKKSEKIHEAYKAGSVRLYKPMPPTIDTKFADGRIERTLGVGIQSKVPEIKSEIIGVNMITHAIVHFKHGAPRQSLGGDDHCGIDDANQKTSGQGVPGEAWISIKDGGKEIWKFMVIRPSASSGRLGSGIELKYVDYKNKRVLDQAHVPILNVAYDENKCGPYRDWQFQEGMFEANGKDVVSGIRICNSKAKTILDTDNDKGNFKGVAIYVDGNEVVLVSEMEAGWYRYISEWRFHTDGTILPRFGFSAVHNNCVCNKHHHNVYWRLDFNIEGSENNLVEEFNDPVQIGNANWHKILYEVRRQKNASSSRKWRISNAVSGSNYELIPGANDGLADGFGVGDFWVLTNGGEFEIDDGVYAGRGSREKCKAHIDWFARGESVDNTDIVIWYGAHFTHDIHVEAGHIIGPTLKCVKW